MRASTRACDVAVIGAGVVGAATALELVKGGARTVLCEQGEISRPAGSSRGAVRIFAPAAYPDPGFLASGLRALAGWRALEQSSGTTLLATTGALSCGEFAALEHPDLVAAGVEAELIDADVAAARFGVNVPAGQPVLYQQDAGILFARRALTLLLQLARAGGAEIRERERVEEVREGAGGVEVRTSGGVLRAAAVVFAAGPWNPALLRDSGLVLSLAPSLQTVALYELRDPDRVPVALMDFYGEEPFACWDTEGRLKAGLHARGPQPEDPDRIEADSQAGERIDAWVRERFGELVGERLEYQACLYTNEPEERFVLERRGPLVIGAACNGQGFQFAPETGRRLAELALGASAGEVAG